MCILQMQFTMHDTKTYMHYQNIALIIILTDVAITVNDVPFMQLNGTPSFTFQKNILIESK